MVPEWFGSGSGVVLECLLYIRNGLGMVWGWCRSYPGVFQKFRTCSGVVPEWFRIGSEVVFLYSEFPGLDRERFQSVPDGFRRVFVFFPECIEGVAFLRHEKPLRTCSAKQKFCSFYEKNAPRHAETTPEPLPNHSGQKKTFPNHSRTTPEPFRNHSRTIPEPLPNHSRTTPKTFPKHSAVLPADIRIVSPYTCQPR